MDEIKAQIALNQDNSLEQTAMVEIKRWIAAFEDLSKSSKELIKAAQAQRDYANTWLDANRKLAKQGAEARIKYEQAKMESAQAEVEVATDKPQQQRHNHHQDRGGARPKVHRRLSFQEEHKKTGIVGTAGPGGTGSGQGGPQSGYFHHDLSRGRGWC